MEGEIGCKGAAMPNPFLTTYPRESIEKAERHWQDIERHEPLKPAKGMTLRRALVREQQEADLDCGYYAVNTVLKNVGAGWSEEAQRQKNAAMQERVSLLHVANSGKNRDCCLHKACYISGLSYLVQRGELSQYDHNQAVTFFAIDSLVPALELRLGEARVRMLAMNNHLSQQAVPLQSLWLTLGQNNADDSQIMDAYKANTDWVICGNGSHWKTYFRINTNTFADLDSLHAHRAIQYLSVEELMHNVHAVAVIIPELQRTAQGWGGSAVSELKGDGNEADITLEHASVISHKDMGQERRPSAVAVDGGSNTGPPMQLDRAAALASIDSDFKTRVKAEYERLVAAAQQEGVVSSQTKKDIAAKAVAIARSALQGSLV